ncbi:HupE/UreJ family protein [Pararhodobacter sp.]|uniref:HupE/UreJ family protein n=1 Tax=Pararhodobacter sp. TaxID=2127056 RepID=UPI002FDE5C96
MRRLLPLLLLLPTPLMAHPGHGPEGGFTQGILHPLLGPDHLLAMLAVGLWAVISGGRALYVYPLTFMAAMLAGGLLGAQGMAFALTEHTILASVIITGAAAGIALKAPLWAAALALAVFGAAHGVAHGLEGPGSAAYAAGFVLATGALHLAGIGLGAFGLRAARIMGAGVALAGVALAFV